jgi:hypothetical protein
MAEIAAPSRLVDLLHARGAQTLAHAGERSLLDHLLGTAGIVRRWGQPEWLQHAALIHSVYGTDSYGERLVPLTARSELAAAAGEQAERLAYLFCLTPRGPLLAGTRHWAPDLPLRTAGEGEGPADDPPTRDELDALVLLHMANLADQAQSRDHSPGRWLFRLVELGEVLDGDRRITPPRFLSALATFSADDEALALSTYVDAVNRSDDHVARMSRFALAAAVCPVIAEPCAWLALLCAAQGDTSAGSAWAATARERLTGLGASWDKRLTYEQWAAVIEALITPRALDAVDDIADPITLLHAVVGGPDGERRPTTSDPSSGRPRFHAYVDALTADARAPYPELPSQPFHDPDRFALVGYLEANFPQIRDELLGLDGARFQRESERIRRRGHWDVAFLYERGRRHDDVCAQCPVTIRGIDTYPAIRGAAGLIYVSRMRAHTLIAAHRGPTNLRVRCHLPLQVPEGDCAIRVGDETRRWEIGRCLVFDDFFEHEAWNDTDEDRIVLIVDLWHPALTPTEVSLLHGLQDYTSAYARRLIRYWSTNAEARADFDG